MWPKNPDKRKDMFVYLIGKVNRAEELHVNSGHAYLRREFSIREPNNKIDEFWEDFKKKHEDQWDSDGASVEEKVEKWLEKHYSISFDEVQCISRIVDRADKKEKDVDEIYHEARKKGFKISQSGFTVAVKYLSLQNRYNPIELRFKKFGKWDGEDYIDILSRCFTLATKDPEHIAFFKSMLKKNLVRSVACALAKTINRYCFVLTGGQKVGKTHFVRWLNPFDKGKYLTSALPDVRRDVDTQIRLVENYIYLLDDIDKFSNNTGDYFKSLVSQDKINVRRPYEKNTFTADRRCSFWATSNRRSILIDETGNSRFLCFEIKRIDFSYSHMPKAQIYAQCIHLLENGFDYELTKEEIAMQTSINKTFERGYDELNLVSEFLEQEGLVVAGADKQWHSMNSIMRHLKANAGVGTFVKLEFVEKALYTLNYEPYKMDYNGIPQQGYYCKLVNKEGYVQSQYGY